MAHATGVAPRITAMTTTGTTTSSLLSSSRSTSPLPGKWQRVVGGTAGSGVIQSSGAGGAGSRSRRADARRATRIAASPLQDEDVVVSGAAEKTTTAKTTNTKVTHIVSDVDGTLLNSQQEFTIRTELAVARAAACGVPLILATGKSRGPWVQKILPKFPIPMPGVFIQGLLTCDADGTVLESIELDAAVAASVVRFAEQRNRTLVAFCGGRILCAERNHLTDIVIDYGEPEPEAVGSLVDGCIEAGIAVNKLLLFASEEDMPAVREEAEKMFEGDCAITTAVAGMLEFLPSGASKGAAVERLLARLGVDAANVMALGDGENDVEMLRLAGLSVAMAGSSPKVVEAAGGNVGLSNDENGVADAIERFVLASRGLAPVSAMKLPFEEEAAEEADAAAVASKDDEGNVDAPVEAAAGAAVEAKAAVEIAAVAVAVAVAEGEEAAKAAEASIDTTRDEEISAAMEEAKRMNAELLQASKVAAERLAKLQGSLREAEEVLRAKEDVEADEQSSAAAAAVAAPAAQKTATTGDWEDAEDADSWEDIAANEQTAAVEAAAAAATERAVAAAMAAEAAVAADAKRQQQQQQQQQRQQQQQSKTPSWGSIGSFFSAALKTVTQLTSPEARAKQAEAERAGAKATLLGAVVSTNIGRDCSAAQLSAVEAAVRRLEALNPTSAPSRSSLMRGRWSAVFTNSRQLLGLDRKLSLVRQSGPIYMAHDVANLRSEVQYTWPVKTDRAELRVSPDGYNMSMNFEQTKLFGMFTIPGGGGEKEYGQLEVTYLDLDMKLCRGAKGTIYVFVQTNSDYSIGDTTSGNVNKQLTS